MANDLALGDGRKSFSKRVNKSEHAKAKIRVFIFFDLSSIAIRALAGEHSSTIAHTL